MPSGHLPALPSICPAPHPSLNNDAPWRLHCNRLLCAVPEIQFNESAEFMIARSCGSPSRPHYMHALLFSLQMVPIFHLTAPNLASRPKHMVFSPGSGLLGAALPALMFVKMGAAVCWIRMPNHPSNASKGPGSSRLELYCTPSENLLNASLRCSRVDCACRSSFSLVANATF